MCGNRLRELRGDRACGKGQPVISTYLSYQIIARDIGKSIDRVAKEPMVERETAYYLSKIGDIKSVDDFMADHRVYSYAIKAHGLEEMGYAKAFMRKVLEGGPDGFAGDLADSKYKALAATFNFKAYGPATTSFDRAQKGTVDKYMRQTLEEEAGNDDTGVRLALYFSRTMPGLAASYAGVGEDKALRQIAYNVLGDEALYKVVRTAFGLPDELAGTNVDRQADLLVSKLEIADFTDPEKFEKFMQRFTALWDVENNASQMNSSLLMSSSSGFDISPDLMLEINNLKLGGR